MDLTKIIYIHVFDVIIIHSGHISLSTMVFFFRDLFHDPFICDRFLMIFVCIPIYVSTFGVNWQSRHKRTPLEITVSITFVGHPKILDYSENIVNLIFTYYQSSLFVFSKYHDNLHIIFLKL